jgi:hypothetical protein
MARKALREGASIVSPETILKVHVSGLAQAGVATGSGGVVSFDRRTGAPQNRRRP